MNYKLEQEHLIISVDSRIYGIDVIHKSCYWLLDKFFVDISIEDQNIISVTLISKEIPLEDSDLVRIIGHLKNSLIDFKNREIISRETKTIRELLVAKAFANCDDFDETPVGNLQDTVGVDMSEYEK